MKTMATTMEAFAKQSAPGSDLADVYRIAFDRSAVGIAITAPSGTHLHANQAFCEFVGYSVAELRARIVQELTHPDDRAETSSVRDRLVRGEISVATRERRFVHKSGLTFWGLVTTTLVRDNDGEPEYLISQVIDISDRKQAEDALRGAEARFRALIGAMQDVIIVLDRDGRYVDVAPNATDRLFRAPSELIGRLLHDVFPVPQADAFLANVRQALETRERVETSYDLVIRGERYWFEASVLPQSDDRVVWIARDVTSRRRAEQALRESEEQLRQAQKMEAVGQLAGGIAHDFNNLLMSIMSNAELATLEPAGSESVSGYIEEIRNASRRARSLTQQLLAFSRKQMLQPVVLDLNAVVADSQLMIRRLVEATVDMRVDLNADLGRVRADPGQVSQVLVNLAVNARDAMPRGGLLTITTNNQEVGASEAGAKVGLKQGSYVAITVRDTGSGMSEEIRARIFEPFFTTKLPGQGTGLGLSTAYGIVKQSGGYIDVESAPLLGTTFTVLLPRVSDPTSATAVPRVDAQSTETLGGTILLVEDDSAVRDAAKRMLTRNGFTVIEAGNGREAVDLWAQHAKTVDAVLTDVVMPAMGGADLARTLRRSRPGLRVVFMSGYTQGTLELSAMDEAATRFLPKPFTSDQLVGTLRGLLQNST